MEKTFVWEAILMPRLHVLLYFWPKKGPFFVPLILEDVCGKTMTDPHSVMQQEGRDFKFYNMLQHTFNKVDIVKVFTPRSQFVCFPNSSEVRVLLHNPSALELRAWTEATEITPFFGPNYFFIPGGNKCYNKLPLQTSCTATSQRANSTCCGSADC